jgi:adenine phosphoribosyltransferase
LSPLDLEALLRSRVREIPDFPEPGVSFKDITPLLADHTAFAGVIDAIVSHHGRGTIDKVAGIEARGFILGAAVAYHFGAGFVPLRKADKLPSTTYAQTYSLEYGEATIEVHQDAFTAGDRVLLVDDVLATGGTVEAAVKLVERAGAVVAGCSVLMELTFLHGRERLAGLDIHTLLSY